MLKNATKVIALTENEKNLYREMGVNPSCVEIIPNGLDIEEVRSKIRPGQFRKKFNMPPDEKIVLFLGRLNQTKGIDLLIRSFAIARLPNTCLVVVGPDDGCLSMAKRIAQDHGVQNQVLFTGPIYGDEKYSVYYDADVFVRSSSLEGMPMAVIESVVCGTPVIITPECGLHDVVNGRIGFVVKPDVDSLSHGLEEILTNKHLHKTFSQNTEEIAKHFDLKEVTNAMEKVYQSILN